MKSACLATAGFEDALEECIDSDPSTAWAHASVRAQLRRLEVPRAFSLHRLTRGALSRGARSAEARLVSAAATEFDGWAPANRTSSTFEVSLCPVRSGSRIRFTKRSQLRESASYARYRHLTRHRGTTEQIPLP